LKKRGGGGSELCMKQSLVGDPHVYDLFWTFSLLSTNTQQQKYSLEMIGKLPGVHMYDSFAYDTALLHYFVNADKGRSTQSGSHTPRAMRLSGGSLRGSIRGSSMRGSFRNRGPFSLGTIRVV
jgi:hypothetical protein